MKTIPGDEDGGESDGVIYSGEPEASLHEAEMHSLCFGIKAAIEENCFDCDVTHEKSYSSMRNEWMMLKV